MSDSLRPCAQHLPECPNAAVAMWLFHGSDACSDRGCMSGACLPPSAGHMHLQVGRRTGACPASWSAATAFVWTLFRACMHAHSTPGSRASQQGQLHTKQGTRPGRPGHGKLASGVAACVRLDACSCTLTGIFAASLACPASPLTRQRRQPLVGARGLQPTTARPVPVARAVRQRCPAAAPRVAFSSACRAANRRRSCRWEQQPPRRPAPPDRRHRRGCNRPHRCPSRPPLCAAAAAGRGVSMRVWAVSDVHADYSSNLE